MDAPARDLIPKSATIGSHTDVLRAAAHPQHPRRNRARDVDTRIRMRIQDQPHHCRPTEPDTPGAPSDRLVSWPRNPGYCTCVTERRGESMTTRPARVPGQQIVCGWCGSSFPLLRTGRLPKWCSDTCRHRAWEQRHARESGRCAVDVVTRLVEVENRSAGTRRPRERSGQGWVAALTELAQAIDQGRVYDRDLRALARGLDQVFKALQRRPAWVRLLR